MLMSPIQEENVATKNVDYALQHNIYSIIIQQVIGTCPEELTN